VNCYDSIWFTSALVRIDKLIYIYIIYIYYILYIYTVYIPTRLKTWLNHDVHERHGKTTTCLHSQMKACSLSSSSHVHELKRMLIKQGGWLTVKPRRQYIKGKHFFWNEVPFLLGLDTFHGPYYNSFGDGYPSFGPAHPPAGPARPPAGPGPSPNHTPLG